MSLLIMLCLLFFIIIGIFFRLFLLFRSRRTPAGAADHLISSD